MSNKDITVYYGCPVCQERWACNLVGGLGKVLKGGGLRCVGLWKMGRNLVSGIDQDGRRDWLPSTRTVKTYVLVRERWPTEDAVTALSAEETPQLWMKALNHFWECVVSLMFRQCAFTCMSSQFHPPQTLIIYWQKISKGIILKPCLSTFVIE